jgi:tetratricopeptide (TPR) repeat protein
MRTAALAPTLLMLARPHTGTPASQLVRYRACRMGEEPLPVEKRIMSVLDQLDQLTAEEAEMRAQREKAEAENRAKATRKVTAFGARLDDDVAGDLGGRQASTGVEHERLFNVGVELMQRGEYKQAVTAFTRATAAAPGGLSDRKGGQYAIYLAQALQAADRKKEAVGLLKRCEAHPDADVRKIADNVLYIMQAPELKLDSDQFVSIPSLQENDDWAMGRRRAIEDKDPPPEKYSLEWYVQEAEKKRGVARDGGSQEEATPVLVACAALLISTAGLLAANAP